MEGPRIPSGLVEEGFSPRTYNVRIEDSRKIKMRSRRFLRARRMKVADSGNVVSSCTPEQIRAVFDSEGGACNCLNMAMSTPAGMSAAERRAHKYEQCMKLSPYGK